MSAALLAPPSCKNAKKRPRTMFAEIIAMLKYNPTSLSAISKLDAMTPRIDRGVPTKKPMITIALAS